MPFFLPKLGKMLQKLSSAAVVTGALKVKLYVSKGNMLEFPNFPEVL